MKKVELDCENCYAEFVNHLNDLRGFDPGGEKSWHGR